MYNKSVLRLYNVCWVWRQASGTSQTGLYAALLCWLLGTLIRQMLIWVCFLARKVIKTAGKVQETARSWAGHGHGTRVPSSAYSGAVFHVFHHNHAGCYHFFWLMLNDVC